MGGGQPFFILRTYHYQGSLKRVEAEVIKTFLIFDADCVDEDSTSLAVGLLTGSSAVGVAELNI